MATENNQSESYCPWCKGPCTGKCWKKPVVMGGLLLLVSGSLFLLALFATSLKEYQYIGRNAPGGELATINVSGDGQAYATPDIAEISFSITQESKTAKEARKIVDDKMKSIHDFLTKSGVKEADIKGSYSLYPKYEWQQKQIVCVAYPCPQPPGKQVLTGWEVSESVDIKVRNIDTNADAAGVIVGGLADNGATNISGPNFTIEDEDTVKETARKDAIASAKAKAEVLARELGVTLVRITAYNEGGNYPVPYAQGGVFMKAMSSDAGAPAPEAANIPAGQNKYTSNVTITYEVR